MLKDGKGISEHERLVEDKKIIVGSNLNFFSPPLSFSILNRVLLRGRKKSFVIPQAFSQGLVAVSQWGLQWDAVGGDALVGCRRFGCGWMDRN